MRDMESRPKEEGPPPKPKGKARPVPAEKGDPDAPAAKPTPGRLSRIWKQVDKFWLGIGLSLALGAGLGLFALVVQTRDTRLTHRKQQVATQVGTLAATLRTHAALPFHPDPAYLNVLTDLARTRSALTWLEASEGAPDADRQAILESELAECMGAYAQARKTARCEPALAALQQAFQRSTAELARLREASHLDPMAWERELSEACQAVGLQPSSLLGHEARLKQVKVAAQILEEALGIALLEAQQLRQPGYEMVSFMPDPKRTTVIGGGWAATGFGADGHAPGGTVAFSVEGTSLVHRLLNVGTWRSLARVETSTQGHLRYVVDTATFQASEQASRHAEAVFQAVQNLEDAWKALNPMAPGLTFTQAPQKTFDDIFVQLEADLNAGTPDGKPDLDLWPSAGEIATVKGFFGESDDLVLLRFPVKGVVRLQVLARAGFVYTNACALDEGQLAVLPGGVLLRLVEVQVPATAGHSTFKVIQRPERPQAQRMPSPTTPTPVQR